MPCKRRRNDEESRPGLCCPSGLGLLPFVSFFPLQDLQRSLRCSTICSCRSHHHSAWILVAAGKEKRQTSTVSVSPSLASSHLCPVRCNPLVQWAAHFSLSSQTQSSEKPQTACIARVRPLATTIWPLRGGTNEDFFACPRALPAPKKNPAGTK